MAGVEIYGGFAGGEFLGPAPLAAKGFTLDETILRGDLNGNNIAEDGDYYHVVSSRNASLGAIVNLNGCVFDNSSSVTGGEL